MNRSMESRGAESLEQSLHERVALLPARLRLARALAELSASELTRLAGFHSMGYASYIESHEAGLRVGSAARLAHVLGLSLDWLIIGKGPEPDPDELKEAVQAARARGPLPRSPSPKKEKKRISPPEDPSPSSTRLSRATKSSPSTRKARIAKAGSGAAPKARRAAA